MNETGTKQAHSVCVHDRTHAELSGIQEVESFQESEIVLSSVCGELSIEGTDLKIDSFSVESGKIRIVGEISALSYFDKPQPARGGLFSRRTH